MKYYGTRICSLVGTRSALLPNCFATSSPSHSYDVEVIGMGYSLLGCDHILVSFSKGECYSAPWR